MNFEYKDNKEIIDIPMTKEEAEVLNNYLLERRIKLENCGLEDSYCYPKITSVYYNISSRLNQKEDINLKEKAFELIVLKNVDVNEIRPNATYIGYNKKIPYYRQSLTEEEFKFLKDVVYKFDREEIIFEVPNIKEN